MQRRRKPGEIPHQDGDTVQQAIVKLLQNENTLGLTNENDNHYHALLPSTQ
jgi:hypothetical protein